MYLLLASTIKVKINSSSSSNSNREDIIRININSPRLRVDMLDLLDLWGCIDREEGEGSLLIMRRSDEVRKVGLDVLYL